VVQKASITKRGWSDRAKRIAKITISPRSFDRYPLNDVVMKKLFLGGCRCLRQFEVSRSSRRPNHPPYAARRPGRVGAPQAGVKRLCTERPSRRPILQGLARPSVSQSRALAYAWRSLSLEIASGKRSPDHSTEGSETSSWLVLRQYLFHAKIA